jgi:peptide/nickel transport system permease protein
VVITYAFRNAMLPVITTLGMVFASCAAPTCWWKIAWPGIGSFMIER